MFFNREHTRTAFVQLNTRHCKACWKCINNCPKQVINKVDLPIHKHALFSKPEACTGCKKCITICPFNAYSSISNEAKQATVKRDNRPLIDFIVNNMLLASGLIMIFSGLVMQLAFHMGNHGEHGLTTRDDPFNTTRYEQVRQVDTSKIACGFNYTAWSGIHKVAIVVFSLLMIYHIYVHRKWYSGVITRHLMGKNKQAILLSVLFLLAAVTGLVPWIIDLSGSKSPVRLLFIEIHDKLTFVLIVFLVIHVTRKAKWFARTLGKLGKN